MYQSNLICLVRSLQHQCFAVMQDHVTLMPRFWDQWVLVSSNGKKCFKIKFYLIVASWRNNISCIAYAVDSRDAPGIAYQGKGCKLETFLMLRVVFTSSFHNSGQPGIKFVKLFQIFLLQRFASPSCATTGMAHRVYMLMASKNVTSTVCSRFCAL